MGSIFSIFHRHRAKSAYLAQSPIHGIGVFSAEYIRKGDLVYCSKCHKSDTVWEHFNDPDFHWPRSFAKADLTRCFSHYAGRPTSANVQNVFLDDGSGAAIAIKDIHPGQEMTKSYGIDRWGTVIAAHIVRKTASREGAVNAVVKSCTRDLEEILHGYGCTLNIQWENGES